MLTQTEFNREVTRERIRAVRRAIPFCVIRIQLNGREQLRRRRRLLIQLLHRHLRLTDHKADFGGTRFAVLLVDTPEMGGRAALDRIEDLCEVQGLNASLTLEVYDPEGFDSDDPSAASSADGRRAADRSVETEETNWTRFDYPTQSLSQASLDQASSVAVVTDVSSTAAMPRSFTKRTSLTSPTQTATDRQPLVRTSGSVPDWYAADILRGPSPVRRFAKRLVDIVGAAVGLIVFAPVLLLCAVAIKVTSVGPVFFCQVREGRGGVPFVIFKLRTMTVDAEIRQSELIASSHRDGPAFKIKYDPRVTLVGQFLRKTCLDELPQLINVLRGEMSLVGPRPLPWKESRACSGWHRRRLDVKPGMTCHWQVNKAAAPTFDDWMRLDLQYVDHATTWQDLQLLARTTVVPLMGRGSD
ncbi:hypothetical protein CGZ80_06565 [Rhodopirellula sp. MGV]|nr:hypothetical protein CGZ80_06565 [Rhodopirellula sp. MGV]PNY36297.1 sugar transferase [Rhodopirellula baltica]